MVLQGLPATAESCSANYTYETPIYIEQNQKQNQWQSKTNSKTSPAPPVEVCYPVYDPYRSNAVEFLRAPVYDDSKLTLMLMRVHDADRKKKSRRRRKKKSRRRREEQSMKWRHETKA